MQHRKLLELIEMDIAGMDWNHLKRAHLLLQSDLWAVGSRLDDRKRLKSDLIIELEAERERVNGAIDNLRRRIQELSAVD